MTDQTTQTGSFDDAITEYLTKPHSADGSREWLMMRWSALQLYWSVRMLPAQYGAVWVEKGSAKRAQRYRAAADSTLAVGLFAAWIALVVVYAVRSVPTLSVAARIAVAVGAAVVSIALFVLVVRGVMVCVGLFGHRVMWRREGSEFGALQIKAEKSGRREIHGHAKWPVAGSTTKVAARLRHDLRSNAVATGTVLTTDSAIPSLRAIYIREGMRPATAQECVRYALKPQKDPLIFP
ncbi:hypothetical protein [Rhodococcus sp. BH5]|uniref:hypothetical protein n=1 Tax=Rhodococcus sp. BH5 TaxID=2871702 RepID=UPI0022CD7BD1|nr:hypothetical protein [Rhodococcus sp. BH5]MCZ9635004.1 hypothetical protein [Rhodococcus sp. BH5]